jgi:hypothetical protein
MGLGFKPQMWLELGQKLLNQNCDYNLQLLFTWMEKKENEH